MNKLFTIPAILLLSMFMVSSVIAPAYMKLGDIKGEANAQGHEEWIQIESWSFGASNSGASGKGGTGRVSFSDLIITKTTDKSTPKLMESVANGKHIPKAEIVIKRQATDGTREEYLKYELENVLVSSYSISGDADDMPTEELSLNFAKIKTTYTGQSLLGRIGEIISFTWDLAKGKKV